MNKVPEQNIKSNDSMNHQSQLPLPTQTLGTTPMSTAFCNLLSPLHRQWVEWELRIRRYHQRSSSFLPSCSLLVLTARSIATRFLCSEMLLNTQYCFFLSIIFSFVTIWPDTIRHDFDETHFHTEAACRVAMTCFSFAIQLSSLYFLLMGGSENGWD